MRILYIVQHFNGPSGSSGSRPYENARRLVQMGHEVTLLCGTSKKSSPQDVEDAKRVGIDLHRAPVIYNHNFSYFKRLLSFRDYMKWAIHEGKSLPKPDVVFASSTPLSVGEIGRQVAKYHGVPFVFEARDLWPEIAVEVGALRNPLLRFMAYRMAQNIYAAADHIIALSPGMKDGIKEWNIPDQCITVIPNCSDTELFGSRQERDSMRKTMGWEDKFVCIHPGSIGLVNNLDYLLDCAKALEQMNVMDIHIAIIGDGRQKAHLRQRIKDENIKLASVFDPIPKKDMPNLLAAADVGMVSFLPLKCLETNSANKFFDFMAAGLPTILNYGGWQASVLRESGAGVSMDPSNPSDMASTLISMRDNPEQLFEMGIAARKLAETKYDRNLLVKQLEEALTEVVDHKYETPKVKIAA